jgi:hypothetical protein
MTTFFRFLLLTTEEKIERLSQEGTLLLIHFDTDTKVKVYALGTYFVEVRYNNSEDEVIEVVAFKNTDRLLQYNHSISLSNLALS